MDWKNSNNLINAKAMKSAQHRLLLTAFGAVRGGDLAEKVILRNLTLFKSAAGEPIRWAAAHELQNRCMTIYLCMEG